MSRPAIFLDRDGTVIHDSGYIRDPQEVRLLPGAAHALRALEERGFALVLASNQSGIGRGLIAAEEAGRVHRRVVERLEEAGVRLAGAYYCPHTPEAGCSCRKPAPELILRAARDLDLDLGRSFTVGDKPSDLEAGRAAGTRAIRFEGDWRPVLAGITAALLDAFAGKQVLVAGDVMLDEYIWGEVRRISPEAPVPVVETARRTYVLGGAGNVAANVVSLGGRALLVGVVGRDPQADLLREALERCGISAQGLLVDETRPTTTKTRVVAHQQQVVRVDCERREPLGEDLAAAAAEFAAGHMAEADACVISDYLKGVVTPSLAQRVIRAASRAGKPVVVDPKNRDFSIYRNATLVTPNLHEAGWAVSREINGHAELEAVGRALLELLEGSALLVTRGREGMSLFRPGAAAVDIPVVARTVYDVTGAGDTVVGTLALALAAGQPLEAAARLANHAAGIVVGKVGTATATREELLEALL